MLAVRLLRLQETSVSQRWYVSGDLGMNILTSARESLMSGTVTVANDLSIIYFIHKSLGRHSSVGIATRFGLGGPGIESWSGWDFPRLPRPVLAPTKLQGHSLRVKWPGRGANVKERVELYFYICSVPLWQVIGRTLPFALLFVTGLELKIQQAFFTGKFIASVLHLLSVTK